LSSSSSSSYERFLLQHFDAITQVENLAASAMWCVPGSMRDNNAEFAYAATRLVALINDRMMCRYAKTSTPFQLNMATLMSVAHAVELLCELLSEKARGKRGKWTAIAVVESFKTLLRLVMLAANRGRMLTAQTVPSRANFSVDLAAVKARLSELDGKRAAQPAAAAEHESPRARATLASAVRQRLQAGGGAESLVADGIHTVAELLWILKPLLSLLALRRFGLKSWRAWSVAVVLDVASRLLHESSVSRKLTPAEQSEQRRRTFLMVLYLFRHPVYSHVEAAAKLVPIGWLERVSFLRAIVHALASYIATFPDRFYYTSTQ
jgi:peroxin-16